VKRNSSPRVAEVTGFFAVRTVLQAVHH